MSLFRSTLKIFLIWKVLVILIFWIMSTIVPVNQEGWKTLNWVQCQEKPGMPAALTYWDGKHYLKLAESFYERAEDSTAFFPLLPACIILGKKLGLSSCASGIVVSFIISFLAIFYFRKLAASLLSPRNAWRALLLFLSFPTAYYLSVVYSEGLFLALALSFTYYLLIRKNYWCLLPAVLLPLSRGQGLLMGGVVFAFVGWTYLWPLVRVKNEEHIEREDMPLNLVAAFAILLGQGLYFLFMQIKLGDPFAGFHAQAIWQGGNSISNLAHPLQTLAATISAKWEWFGFNSSGVDRIAFVFVLIFAVPVLKSRNAFMVLSYLALAIVPAFMGPLTGYCRYALCIFPIFLYGPRLFQSWGSKYFYALIILFIAAQIFLIARFANFYWVA